MRRKKLQIKIIIVIGLVLIISKNIYDCRKLKVTQYVYKSDKIANSFRIVQLSDLHSQEYGLDNIQLVKTIKENNPDIITMTGDMVDNSDKTMEGIVKLSKQLMGIAPVFYSVGNNEYGLKGNKFSQLVDGLVDLNVTVVNEDYVETIIKGNKIRLGGSYGVGCPIEKMSKNQISFMERFQDTEQFKLLLNHKPIGLLRDGGIEYWNLDLVLTGHTHGGQIQVPFVGGLFTREEGFFPTYTKGIYYVNQSAVVISAGLANTTRIPRINNNPEIVIIDVEKSI